MESEQGIEKYGALLNQAYEDAINGVITKEEFADFKKAFTEELENNKRLQVESYKKRDMLVNLSVGLFPWIGAFKRYKSADALTRQMLVELVEYITVDSKKQVTVTYRCQKEIEEMSEYCSKRGKK